MGKKKMGKHKESSRQGHTRRVGRAMNRLMIKIKRWERYQQEIQKGKRDGIVARWSTAGLEKQLDFLGGLKCVGIKQR